MTEISLDSQLPHPRNDLAVCVLKFDLLVHAWDLARATGQSFDPPASAVEESMQVARMLISSEMRDGGMFAAEVVPGADASAIDRLAAFSGRQP